VGLNQTVLPGVLANRIVIRIFPVSQTQRFADVPHLAPNIRILNEDLCRLRTVRTFVPAHPSPHLDAPVVLGALETDPSRDPEGRWLRDGEVAGCFGWHSFSAGMAGRGAWTDGTQGPGRQRIAALLLHGPFERLAGADSNKSPEHNSNLAMPRFRHVQILFCGNASMLKRQISNVKAEMAGLQYRPVEMPKQIREPQAALCRGSHPSARRPGIEHTTALRLPGLEHTTASRPPGLEQTTALRPPGLEHSTALHISAPPRREKITFRLCAKCFVTRSLFVAP